MCSSTCKAMPFPYPISSTPCMRCAVGQKTACLTASIPMHRVGDPNMLGACLKLPLAFLMRVTDISRACKPPHLLKMYSFKEKHRWQVKLHMMSGITLLQWTSFLCRFAGAFDALYYLHRVRLLNGPRMAMLDKLQWVCVQAMPEPTCDMSCRWRSCRSWRASTASSPSPTGELCGRSPLGLVCHHQDTCVHGRDGSRDPLHGDGDGDGGQASARQVHAAAPAHGMQLLRRAIPPCLDVLLSAIIVPIAS